MLKFNHCCHNVFDMERSIKFYSENFGLVKVNEINDNPRRLVFLALPDDPGFCIELISNSDRKKPYKLGDKGFHVAFFSDNFVKDLEMHKKAGIVVLEQPEWKIYFVEDPDGYQIEILEQR